MSPSSTFPPAALLSILLGLLAPLAPITGEPHPVSDAERAAVVLAAAYLDRGPEAWWEELASNSPLKSLGREAALGEIEVRAGAPAGARWELQTAPDSQADDGAIFVIEFPSGIDETLFLRLAREGGDGGSWKIASLRILAEPVGPSPRMGAAPPKPGESTERASAFALSSLRLPLLVIALLLAVGSLALRRRIPAFGWVGLTAALAAAAAVVVIHSAPQARTAGGAREGPQEAAVEESPLELRELLPYRRAMTSSTAGSPDAVGDLGLDGLGPVSRTARLWRGQQAMVAMDFNQVESLIGSLSARDRTPLAHLLKGHLELARRSEVDAAIAYENLLDLGLVYDGLLIEAAKAFSFLGFERRAREFLIDAKEVGSRSAETYYFLAEYAAFERQETQAEKHMATGWQLAPIERSEILGRPLLSSMLGSLSFRARLDLDAPEEPPSDCRGPGTRAISIPPGFDVYLLGDGLVIEAAGASLTVPGACDLAPAKALVTDPSVWRRKLEKEALAGLEDLQRSVGTGGAIARPVLRRKALTAARALDRNQEWDRLVELTDSLDRVETLLPPGLARLRARALDRTGRKERARDLLIRVAREGNEQSRSDPATLQYLSELLIAEGRYDLGLRMMAKANSQLPYEPDGERLRRIQLEKRLAANFSVFLTEHFEMRFPPAWSDFWIEKASDILEAEHKRLRKWIPVPSGGKRIEVNYLPYEDFRDSYAPNLEIVGLYDGKIRVPLGDIPSFHPVFVAILTHELAHAMIADATGDRAPHWFHEGLAQHVQMVQGRINPIADFRFQSMLVSFPLIEPTLTGFTHPDFVSVAYDEANWTLHFIERRYGVRAIHKLLAAFREGSTSDAAIHSVLGKTVLDFDRELWDWCEHKAPATWPVKLVRYDEG